MKHPWRRAGLTGIGLTSLALVIDLVQQRPVKTTAPTDVPPGIIHQVDPHLGSVEISHKGPFILMGERNIPEPGEGFVAREERYRMEGRDPRPEGENGLRFSDVVVTGLQRGTGAEAEPAYRISAISAWVPLVPDLADIKADPEREWLLRQPTLRLPNVLQGRELVLDTEEAALDPNTGAVRCEGLFLLRGEGLRLAGADLRMSPEGVISWQPHNGLVEWEFVTEDGSAYRGSADTGGRWLPADQTQGLEDYGADSVLDLPAASRSRIEFPLASGLPGVLETGGLRLLLAESSTGLQPRIAEGRTATRFRTVPGPPAAAPAGEPPAEGEADPPRIANVELDGGACTAEWDNLGALEGVHILGPVDFVHQRSDEEGPAWGSARSGAWVGPGDERLYLYGGVHMLEARGELQAVWVGSDEHGRSAGGGVFLDSPEGTVVCERLEPGPRGSWKLLGRALVYPPEGQVQVFGAPEIEHLPGAESVLEGGFAVAGREGGEPWSLRGERLRRVERHGDQRLTAEGALVWSRAGAQLHGDKLTWTGDSSAVLSGNPATATLAAFGGAGSSMEAECERFTFRDADVLLHGTPLLRMPATSFGLSGGEIEVRAGSMQRLGESGAWELVRRVRFSGALQGEARRADWSLEDGMTLSGRSEQPWLAGASAEGLAFRVLADSIVLDPQGSARLRGHGLARFTDEEAGVEIELGGSTMEIQMTSGWCEGSLARVDSGEVHGTAQRVEWELSETGSRSFLLIGRAHLESPDGEADGDRLLYDPGTNVLELWGSEEKPAVLALPDGRRARGTRLRLDLEHRLLSGDDFTIGQTKP